MSSQAQSRPAVVVTGASSGIGRAIASVAAREGGPVMLIARSPEQLAEAAQEVQNAGGKPLTLRLDLMERGASGEVADFLAAHDLHCDVLVNSAGVGLRGSAAHLPEGEQLGLIDLNIRALTEMTLRFLPDMVARGRGGVINLSSVAGFIPGPNMALYFASKAFVRSFSQALSEEVGGTGVTVTCVAPGPVRSTFLGRAAANRAKLFKMLPKNSPEAVADAAWRAFRSGRRLAVPGASAKLAVVAVSVLPHALMIPLVGRLLR